VETRNALAARALRAGNKEAAARVRALAKPTAPAWALNQLFWKAPDTLAAVLRAGEAVRSAQTAGGPRELAEAMRGRRETVLSALRHAEAVLAESAQGASEATRRRVEASLEALAGHPPDRLPAPLGRLSAEVAPAGFEALAGESVRMPASAAAEAAPAAWAREPEDEAARAARQEAAAELARRRRAVMVAREAAAQAERRAEGALAEREEAQRRLARAVERVQETSRELERARAALAQAEEGVALAEGRAETAPRPPGPGKEDA
jgi:hypothetical protein